MALRDILFGTRLASSEEEHQRVGTIAAIPMLGLDALGSAAYGPEAALTLLLPLGVLGLSYILPISLLIMVLLCIVYFSYRQTIAAYPSGGGSYTVARSNLGTSLGLLAAAALLLDYILVVAIGISAGIGALVSAVPLFQPYTLTLCLITLAFIALVNLRGVRESGVVFILPTYLFVTTLFAVLAIGVVTTLSSHGAPVPVVTLPQLPAAAGTAGLWLLLQSFASGCTAMTGVEAISNGVTAFREPRAVRAQRTLTAVILILIVLLAGIAYLVRAYGIGATEPGRAGYESVLSQLVAAVVGRGVFYYVTIAGILSVLALSANTGFADFPRLCRVIAQDGYLPRTFASRGRRLVYSEGIYVLTALAALLLVRALAADGRCAGMEEHGDQWCGCGSNRCDARRRARRQVCRRRVGHDAAHPWHALRLRRGAPSLQRGRARTGLSQAARRLRPPRTDCRRPCQCLEQDSKQGPPLCPKDVTRYLRGAGTRQ